MRKAVLEHWGKRCILEGFHHCQGPVEVMHIRTRGAHPELAADIYNGLPGCAWAHRLGQQNFQFTPEWTKALWLAGEVLQAARRGEREEPTFEELQQLIVYRILKGAADDVNDEADRVAEHRPIV